MKTYNHNDCGVVTNPDIIFYFIPKNALAWLYWEIKVGKGLNGLWDFGWSTAGGSSAVSNGKFKTKEEAIDAGIDYMKNWFDRGLKTNIITESDFKHGKKAFEEFLESRSQLSLF
jgi:hypothetical protein